MPDELLFRLNTYFRLINVKIPLATTVLAELLYEKEIIERYSNGKKYTYRKKISFTNGRSARMFVLDMDKLMSYDIDSCTTMQRRIDMKSNMYSDGEVEVVAITTDELQKILSVGRTAALRIAKDEGARIDLGSPRILRFNYQKIKDYVDSMSF